MVVLDLSSRSKPSASPAGVWLDAAYLEARRMVAERRETVLAVAEALLDRETLSGDQVREVIRNNPYDRPTAG